MVFSGSIRNFGFKDLAVSFGGAVLYMAVNLLLDPEVGLIFSTNPFSTRFPGIVVLVIVAIFYGPIVGILSSGLGTLGYTLILRFLIFDTFIPRGDVLLIVGAMIAGMVAGGFSVPFRAKDIEIENITGMESWKDLFSAKYLRNLLRNTIAAVLGYAFVFSLWVTYGNRIFNLGFVAYPTFIQISYGNGLFLIVAVPLVYLLITILDFLNEKQTMETMQKVAIPKIVSKGGNMFEISSVEIPPEETIWQDGWGALNMKVRNVSQEPKKFEVRVTSSDIFSPDSHETPLLQPNQEDGMYFNVFGLSSGEKKATVIASEKNTEREEEAEIQYFVQSSSSVLIQRFSALFLVLGLGVAVVAIIDEIMDDARLDTPVLISLLAIPLEVILILVLNWLYSKKTTRTLVKIATLGMIGREEEQSLEHPHDEETFVSELIEIENRNRRISRLFLSISAILFVSAWAIIILTRPAVLRNRTVNFGDLIFYNILALIVTSIASQVFLERAEQARQKLEEHEAAEKRIIKSMIASSSLVRYKETKMVGKAVNPLETQGIRIYIHSLDHVVPRMILLDIPPKAEASFEFNYVPLDAGVRKISFEIVPFKDAEGNLIPGEEAETFDQETVSVRSASQLALGLTPTQIQILKRLITGASVVAVAVTFLARIFGIALDPVTLRSTVPLVIILQSPVIYLYLYLRNRRAKSLMLEE